MKQYLSSFVKKLMKSWSWILLIITVLLIKFASTEPLWVEENYSTVMYPVISKFQRAVFGWMPFSIGDLLYTFIGLIIIIKVTQLVRLLYYRKFTRPYLLSGLKQLIFFFLLVYVLFYGLWGLNYSRKGIAYQLGLEVREYTQQDLDTLVITLQQRLNHLAGRIDTLNRDSTHRINILFRKGEEAYLAAMRQYPFLNYSPRSIKTSLYSPFGHLLGVHGYYNPFSGEAQINRSIPKFLHPSVITHEIGHQLGYGLENEANFTSFLACKTLDDVDFKYSMYFDMYFYSVRDMFRFDIKTASCYRETLDTIVKLDYKSWVEYRARTRNPIQPFVSRFYDNYLKANNQPAGMGTYNQVVGWLVAYYKKNGKESL